MQIDGAYSRREEFNCYCDDFGTTSTRFYDKCLDDALDVWFKLQNRNLKTQPNSSRKWQDGVIWLVWKNNWQLISETIQISLSRGRNTLRLYFVFFATAQGSVGIICCSKTKNHLLLLQHLSSLHTKVLIVHICSDLTKVSIEYEMVKLCHDFIL